MTTPTEKSAPVEQTMLHVYKEVIDWLQYGDEFDEDKAGKTLALISFYREQLRDQRQRVRLQTIELCALKCATSSAGDCCHETAERNAQAIRALAKEQVR